MVESAQTDLNLQVSGAKFALRAALAALHELPYTSGVGNEWPGILAGF